MKGGDTVTLPTVKATTAARPERAAERVNDLAVRLAPACSNAVDALEIAALLENEGINDTLAAQRYGHRDVFTLAEELYAQSPRRPAPRMARPPLWHTTVRHHVLRGALFGLPGLLYAAAGRSVSGDRALVLIAVSLLVSWGASEGLSFLGYQRLGANDRPGAERTLRRGLGAALLLLVPAICLTGHLLGLAPGTTAFAAGQAVYMLAATVVLITGGEWLLLAALAPGVAAGVAQLTGVRAGTVTNGTLWDGAIWGGVVLTVATTLTLAIVRTRRSYKASGPWLRGGELARTLPHAAFGLCAGGLITVGASSALAGTDSSGTVMALPLSLSMGGAEWLLFRYRRRTGELLDRAASLTAFTRRARRALLGAVFLYVTLLTTIADAAAWAGRLTGTFTVSPGTFWTSVLLGGALFTALALRSGGITNPVLALCGFAVFAQIAVLTLAPAVPLVTVQLVACGALFAALLACAYVWLGRATRHR